MKTTIENGVIFQRADCGQFGAADQARDDHGRFAGGGGEDADKKAMEAHDASKVAHEKSEAAWNFGNENTKTDLLGGGNSKESIPFHESAQKALEHSSKKYSESSKAYLAKGENEKSELHRRWADKDAGLAKSHQDQISTIKGLA